jgi:hypothetical protein
MLQARHAALVVPLHLLLYSQVKATPSMAAAT